LNSNKIKGIQHNFDKLFESHILQKVIDYANRLPIVEVFVIEAEADKLGYSRKKKRKYIEKRLLEKANEIIKYDDKFLDQEKDYLLNNKSSPIVIIKIKTLSLSIRRKGKKLYLSS
jgi:hypothetical protein